MMLIHGGFTLSSGISFFIIILIASILQTSTGFGFSIMATPFLLMLFLPNEAIQINLILSLIISILLMRKIKGDIDFTLFKRFTVGSIIGVPIGIIIFLQIKNINNFKIGVSIILLLLTILLIFRFRLKRSTRKDFVIGGFSGLLTTSIGMPGPPLLLYLTGTNTEKASLRATTLAFYLFIYFISLLTQISFTGMNKIVWQSSFWAIPVVFIGLFLGQLLFKRINQQAFQVLTYILLLFTSIYLFIDSLLF